MLWMFRGTSFIWHGQWRTYALTNATVTFGYTQIKGWDESPASGADDGSTRRTDVTVSIPWRRRHRNSRQNSGTHARHQFAASCISYTVKTELEGTHRVRTHAELLYPNPNVNLDLWPFNPKTGWISQKWQVRTLWNHSFLSYAADKETDKQINKQTASNVLPTPTDVVGG